MVTLHTARALAAPVSSLSADAHSRSHRRADTSRAGVIAPAHAAERAMRAGPAWNGRSSVDLLSPARADTLPLGLRAPLPSSAASAPASPLAPSVVTPRARHHSSARATVANTRALLIALAGQNGV